MNQDAMADVLAKLRPGVTVHGFRSTFRDWAAETTGYPEPRRRNGARARDPERRRGRLPARRPVREAAAADGRMGGVLRQRARERRRGRAYAGPGMKINFTGPLAEPIYREDWYDRSWLEFSE